MAILDIREMLHLSIRDEETGIVFYTALAENAANENLRNAFRQLAREEQRHAARFQDMLDDCGSFSPRETYSGEYENYMNVLLSRQPSMNSAEAARLARESLSLEDSIDLALSMERDALLFYMEMRNFVDEEHQKIIQAIMDEERNHVFELTRIRQEIPGTEPA